LALRREISFATLPRMTSSIYDRDLDKNPANFSALSPLSFIAWSARVYPEQVSVIHGARRQRWHETYARSRQLASALAARGIGRGDTVSVMLSNTPEMYEAHFGVPMCGAVLNTLNTRLDAEALAFILDHAEAKVLLVDREFSGVIANALERVAKKPLVIDVVDSEYTGPGERIGSLEYEAFIATGGAAPATNAFTV
jgi:fatty-acyl-CoA synthase